MMESHILAFSIVVHNKFQKANGINSSLCINVLISLFRAGVTLTREEVVGGVWSFAGE